MIRHSFLLDSTIPGAASDAPEEAQKRAQLRERIHRATMQHSEFKEDSEALDLILAFYHATRQVRRQASRYLLLSSELIVGESKLENMPFLRRALQWQIFGIGTFWEWNFFENRTFKAFKSVVFTVTRIGAASARLDGVTWQALAYGTAGGQHYDLLSLRRIARTVAQLR